MKTAVFRRSRNLILSCFIQKITADIPMINVQFSRQIKIPEVFSLLSGMLFNHQPISLRSSFW